MDHVTSGLKTKRAELSGLIIECEKHRAALRETLDIIDAALRQFAYAGDPADIKSRRKNRWMFKRGELKRAVLAALRAADGPLSNAYITEQVITWREWVSTPALVDTVADMIKDVRKLLPPSVEPQLMLNHNLKVVGTNSTPATNLTSTLSVCYTTQ